MAKAKSEKWLTDEGLTMIEEWAVSGLTDSEISNNMGIACSTLYEWEKKYPEISDALKRGKAVADFEVEDALFKRAIGYKSVETKEVIENGKTVSKTVTEKEVAPNVTAQIFWLKNRRPNEWRDNPPNEIDMEDSDAYFETAELTEKELGGEQ